MKKVQKLAQVFFKKNREKTLIFEVTSSSVDVISRHFLTKTLPLLLNPVIRESVARISPDSILDYICRSDL